VTVLVDSCLPLPTSIASAAPVLQVVPSSSTLLLMTVPVTGSNGTSYWCRNDIA